MKTKIIPVIILTCLLFCNSLAQETRGVLIFQGDTVVRTSILNSDLKIDLCINKYYYWYDSERIFSNQGGYYGNLLNGEYRAFLSSGNLVISGSFSKGLKNGEWFYWGVHGKIMKRVNYKSGYLHGKMILYSEDGQLQCILNYKKDKLKREKIFNSDINNSKAAGEINNK
jgi:antitoxin component YwqK of YwqJK toxin-antitoxin module